MDFFSCVFFFTAFFSFIQIFFVCFFPLFFFSLLLKGKVEPINKSLPCTASASHGWVEPGHQILLKHHAVYLSFFFVFLSFFFMCFFSQIFKKKTGFPLRQALFLYCSFFFFFFFCGFSPFLVLFDYFSVSRDFLRQPFPQCLVVPSRGVGSGGKRGPLGWGMRCRSSSGQLWVPGKGPRRVATVASVTFPGPGHPTVASLHHHPSGVPWAGDLLGTSLLISLGTTGVLFLLLASAVAGVPLL